MDNDNKKDLPEEGDVPSSAESIHPTSIIGMAHQKELVNQHAKISYQEHIQKLQERITQLEKDNQELREQNQASSKGNRQPTTARVIFWIGILFLVVALIFNVMRELNFHPVIQRRLSTLEMQIATRTQELKQERAAIDHKGRQLFLAQLDLALKQKLLTLFAANQSQWTLQRDELQMKLTAFQKTPRKILARLSDPQVIRLRKEAIIIELQQLATNSVHPRSSEIKQELVLWLKAKNSAPSLADEEDIAFFVRQFSMQVQKQALDIAIDKDLSNPMGAEEVKVSFAQTKERIAGLESELKTLREARKKFQSQLEKK